MQFGEFKNKIEQIFNEKFGKSHCECRISNCLGKSITIDCLLAENAKECQWNQPDNDVMSVLLDIQFPREWRDDDELPENLTMQALRNSIKVKPTEACFYCSYKSVNFRKTQGDSEKMIDTFRKFIDCLYAMMKEEYQAKNLMDYDMALIKSKGYFGGENR